MGGTEPSTLKDLSHVLGKETIDELAVMDGDKCILQLRGVRSFLSDKYDDTKHPLYQETGEYDDRNKLDIEKFLKQEMKFKKGEVFDVVKI